MHYLKEQTENDNRAGSGFLKLSISRLYSTSLVGSVFPCMISTGGYGNYEKQGRNYYAFLKDDKTEGGKTRNAWPTSHGAGAQRETSQEVTDLSFVC